MAEILRDSVFGHGVRLITGNKYFQYPEEKDLSIWERCLSPEKSAQMAVEGRIGLNVPIPNQDSETSSRTIADDALTEKASGDLPTDSPSTVSPTENDIENMDFANGPDEKADEPRGILNYFHDGNTTARPQTNERSSTADQVERTRSSSLRPATTNKSERPGPINRIDTSTSTQAGPPLEPIINTISGVRVDPEKGQDLHVVDWYGPDDPENPMNWSRGKKFFVTFEICLLTTSVYIGSAIFSAGIQSVVNDFGVSPVAATLGLCLFVAGYGLGPMLWAPMSEIPQIGRNPIYIGTLVLFVILQVPTALATNFGMLLAFRFITGFVGSPVLATGGASLADMYRPSKRAYAISVWGVAAVCGPVMGPLVGGFAAEAEGWAWTIWELMWLSGASLVFLLFLLPETSSSNILYRRARRLRKLTGDSKLKTEGEIVGETMTTNDIILMVLVRPITLNFHEPMVFLLNLYIALVYGLLYIWFESFPIVFIEIYHFTLGELGLAFIGILCGVFIVIPPFFYYLYKILEPQFNENGELKPEKRLPPAMVGAFFIPICLFWFGWSSRASIHWIMPIIGTSFFSVGAFLLFNSVLNYLGDAYPEYAASVLAGNDLMRSSFGAGFPLFATAMYKNLGVDWASSTLGFLAIAFIPIPFFLYKYGERLRRISKYARKDF